MEFNLDTLVRENIKKMTPYSSARHEFSGAATVFLDANENAFGSPLPVNYNRYPDPLQWPLKEKISQIKGVPPSNIFLGNGSDEAIDLLFRIFCEPGQDNVIIFPPTYGMYEVCAEINNVAVKKVPLTRDYQLDLEATEAAVDANTKLIFVCSPNNPTGNSIERGAIEVLLNNFAGLVVIDEAYINYARQKTFITELTEYPNLVILQTLSKAWGLAGLRLGMAFAGQPVIDYMNQVKYPYNINTATQQLALEALSNISSVNNWTKTTVVQKDNLSEALLALPVTEKVYPSDANFILVKMTDARRIYEYLAGRGIIVRDRSKVMLCDDCLRITIGTPEENNQLLEALKKYMA
ncbi:MAG TPA: histidinol-phosphate transaminase [Chitinophagaceae bacterium]|nr:histidinol-phosphate transaminase [Chitinophagaceae bacterium]HPH30303.1 histidinol-phosphate transaminase [Chitinophagaceae bacterium]HPN57631.1 histidinol-phosphate transaminase [Chitinophagaceae bacterium]